jgi:hypothetical protein
MIEVSVAGDELEDRPYYSCLCLCIALFSNALKTKDCLMNARKLFPFCNDDCLPKCQSRVKASAESAFEKGKGKGNQTPSLQIISVLQIISAYLLASSTFTFRHFAFVLLALACCSCSRAFACFGPALLLDQPLITAHIVLRRSFIRLGVPCGVVDVTETSEACVSLVVKVNVVGHVTQKTETKVFQIERGKGLSYKTVVVDVYCSRMILRLRSGSQESADTKMTRRLLPHPENLFRLLSSASLRK